MVNGLLTKVSAKKAGNDLNALYDNVHAICSGQAFEPPKPGQKKKKLVEDSPLSKALDKHPELREKTLNAIASLTKLPITEELYGAGKGLKNLINDWQEQVSEQMAQGMDITSITTSDRLKTIQDKMMSLVQLDNDNSMQPTGNAPEIKPGR